MKTTDRLLINVAEVKEDGLEVKGNLPSSVFDLSQKDSERLECPHPLDYDLRAFLVSHGLLVQGLVATTARCRCDRCLTYFDLPLEDDDVCHFYEGEDEGYVDVTDDLREDLLIQLPNKSLCDAACKGICGICGQNLNIRACDCKDEDSGPDIWHQLDDLDL